MATLYCTEHVHIAQTLNLIPSHFYWKGQESESESVSGNVYELITGDSALLTKRSILSTEVCNLQTGDFHFNVTFIFIGLFPPPDSDSDKDSCTMQIFPLVQIGTLIP